MKTLGQALADAAMGTAGVRFVNRDETARELPYAELYARALCMAQHLQQRGVGPTDVVALILPTGPLFYDAFFGVVLAGAVPVALYPPVRLGHLQRYHAQTAQSLLAARAVIVLTDTSIRRMLGQSMAEARPALGCVAIDTWGQTSRDDASSGPAPDAQAFAAPGLDATALLQFSSGTTGAPKAIALTHRQLGANITAIAKRLYQDAPLPVGQAQHSAVSWLPLYHDMGLVGCMLTALVERSSLSLIAPEVFVTRPAIWLRTIARYRASVSAAPNFAYSLCTARIRDADIEGIDLSCWQVALNGAEAVSAPCVQAFEARFAPYGLRPHIIAPVYGLAEAGLAVTFSTPGVRGLTLAQPEVADAVSGLQAPTSSQTFVSVGTPLTGYRVAIVDAAGTRVADGHTGHLHVSGPSIAASDAAPTDSEQDAPRAAPGWLATGDLGFVRDGELFIVGRHKDIIIIRGRNIAPHLIEQRLDDVPGVRQGCTVAASHRPEGFDTDVLVLLVERKGAPDADADTVLAQRIEQAALEACQIRAETVVLCAPGTLPRTSSGKLRRQAALSAFAQNRLQAPAAVSWWRLGLQMWHSQRAMPKAAKRGVQP